jgi:hypothetical protein
MKFAGQWAEREVRSLEEGWKRVWTAIDNLGIEGLKRPTSAGWTAKEMLAHLAFWEETAVPVITSMLRGGPEVPLHEWYGGDERVDLSPGQDWTHTTQVHNAREARWARAHSAEEIIERLRKAQRSSVKVMSTITDEEGEGVIGKYWSGEARCAHFDEHLGELGQGV